MEPGNVENDFSDCDCGWKPRVGMLFDTEQRSYEFYTNYGARVGFSVRRDYINKNKEGHITSRKLVCNKEGFRQIDKRDPLTKNPRQEVRTGCEARLIIKWDRLIRKYIVSDFAEEHNHSLALPRCAHMLPFQMKTSLSQTTEAELAEQSEIHLSAAFERREVGESELLGLTKLDQKIYLRTKRQKSLEYGEAGSMLHFFREKTLKNPSFFYAVQLDNEEQITNVFWADAQMIVDYSQFGDVVTFDTTYKLNNEYRPFASFIGFNHYRETIVFGAALMYDETVDSFIWLFRAFLEVMSNKAPKTIFSDQDVAMAKVIPVVMPDTCHHLCSWHFMQNVLQNVKDKEINGTFSKFLYEIEDKEEFESTWDEMLDKYELQDNHWLKQAFEIKEIWGWPYVRSSWAAGMSTTQHSESFNILLKDYIQSDCNLLQFLKHFDWVLCDKRYNELQVEYALCQKLPMVKINVKMLKQAGDLYTKTIFEEFQDEFVNSIETTIEDILHDGDTTVYTVVDDDDTKVRKVMINNNDSLACSCRKFEIKGILCSQFLKVLREIKKIKELPEQYILKRWTKKARSKNVKDRYEHDIRVDVELHQTLRYKSLMAIFRAIACRASEREETYNISVTKMDELSANIESILSTKMNTQIQGNSEQGSPPNMPLRNFEVDGLANANAVQAKRRRFCLP